MQQFSIQEAAYRLRVSEKTIRRWIRDGKIENTMRDGKYLISQRAVDTIQAQKETGGYETLARRIEAVETALTQLSQRVDEIVSETVRRRETETVRQPSTLRPSRAVYTPGKGDTLPPGLVGWRQFADAHNIAQSTVQRAVESGRLPVVCGEWKRGRAIVKQALDAEGQRAFIALYAESYPGFKVCCSSCPASHT